MSPLEEYWAQTNALEVAALCWEPDMFPYLRTLSYRNCACFVNKETTLGRENHLDRHAETTW